MLASARTSLALSECTGPASTNKSTSSGASRTARGRPCIRSPQGSESPRSFAVGTRWHAPCRRSADRPPPLPTLRQWAEDYYEVPVDLEAVRHVLSRRPLTEEVVSTLNSEIALADLAEDIAEIGSEKPQPPGLSLACLAVPGFCSGETVAVPVAVAAVVVAAPVATPIPPVHPAVIPSVPVTIPESVAEAPLVFALTLARAGVGLARRCRCCRHRLQAKRGEGEDEDRSSNGRSLTEPWVHDRTPLQHRSHRSLPP